MAEEARPHVILFPFPIQGHMPPMLKLAELLSSANFLITFVNTEYSHQRFSRYSSALQLLEQQPNFRFRTVPDGLPEDDPRLFQHFIQLEESLRTRSREHYRELLVPTTTGPDPDGWPPVNCVVADAILSLAIEVTEEVGIPLMTFRTSSACSFWVFRCLRGLSRREELPFPEGFDLDELIQGVEGTESFLRRRDLPPSCRDAKKPSDPRLQILTRITDNAGRGRALIMNTFQSLEGPMLSRIRSFCPIIYTIGPIHMLARNLRPNNPTTTTKNQVSANLWQEDWDCMAWLDSQPPKSVVYVSFGSIALMSREQMMELWQGLVNSGYRFLWVVRQDLVTGGASTATVPPELEERTRERGCLVSWAPQEEVLAHPAVGCFLTHSGWNSTMESIAAGMPMICWPFITDQHINSRFVSEVWKIGLDMKDKCSSSIIEKTVRDAMEGDKAEELRRSVGEKAKEARASVVVAEERGSSYLNLQDLIRHIKALSSN